MRIAVFGTGGVGGYFGGRLAQSGQSVVFIARGEHLRAIRERGLQVESIKGDFVVNGVEATDKPAEAGIADAVLVAVKAWQVSDAAVSLKPMVGRNTFVVPLENGVEAPDQLAAVLGISYVLGGLCRIISYVSGPGQIRHTGVEPVVTLGELDNRTTERLRRLHDAFTKAGVKVEIPTNIQVAIWEKFLFIASVSGVGAVTRAPVGIIRSNPGTRKMLQDAMLEILKVAQARGIPISDDSINRTMAYVDSIPAEGTASMQRDIMEGRASELDAQSGAVVRLGKELHVPTPIHAFIYSSLLPSELRARGKLGFP